MADRAALLLQQQACAAGGGGRLVRAPRTGDRGAVHARHAAVPSIASSSWCRSPACPRPQPRPCSTGPRRSFASGWSARAPISRAQWPRTAGSSIRRTRVAARARPRHSCDGLVDVHSMRFAGPTVRLARRAAAARSRAFDAWSNDTAIQLFRGHPELAGPSTRRGLGPWPGLKADVHVSRRGKTRHAPRVQAPTHQTAAARAWRR